MQEDVLSSFLTVSLRSEGYWFSLFRGLKRGDDNRMKGAVMSHATKYLRICFTVLGVSIIALAQPGFAAVIGTESFNYPDGGIIDQTGGTGFDYDNTFANDPFIGHTGSTSDWDSEFNVPTVSGGALVTHTSGVSREYNGPQENGGHEWDGAINEEPSHDASAVFCAFDMTRGAGNTQWSGASSYDFGTEKIFFGVLGADSANGTIGIEESGVGHTLGNIQLAQGRTYRIVTVLDYDNDLLGLFVDPDGADFWDMSDGSNSADVTRAYTGTNWSTAIRLASGQQVTWDNLIVATGPADVGVPEPCTVGLIAIGSLGLVRRRRRK